MKVELTGISKETFPPAQGPDVIDTRLQYQVVARLNNFDGQPYSFITVPVEMIGDAKIGDIFTLHLERTR